MGQQPPLFSLLQLSELLPSNHPDIDDLFQQPEDFPDWHIDLSVILIEKSAFPTAKPTAIIEVNIVEESTSPTMPTAIFDDAPATEISIEQVNLIEDWSEATFNDAPATEFSIEQVEDNIEDNEPTTEGVNIEDWSVAIFDDAPATEFSIEEVEVDIEDNQPTTEEVSIEDNQPITEEDLPSESPTAQAILDTVESMSVEVLPTDIPFSVYSGHRALVKEMIVPPFKHHPTINHLFMAHQPPDHPNIDDMIEEGFTLPRWHPSISHMIIPRALAVSPGSLLCYALSALFLVAILLRNYKHWHNSNRSNEKSFPGENIENDINDDTKIGSSDGHSSSDGTRSSTPPPPPPHDEAVEIDPLTSSMSTHEITLSRLDQRYHNAMEISRINNESDAEPVQCSIIAYREKRNTRLRSAWIKIVGKRALGTYSSNGELVFCLFYLVLNSLALLLSPYDLNVGFGSLAAGNIVFLVVSAIKNSVFTWFLGMAFDQVVVYHQFIGRVTVVTSFIHSCFYFNRLVEFMSDRVYKTGFIALMFGIFITISSINWIRRKYFNAFYWSHVAFVGFVICVYMHAGGARPFVLAAVASYAVDKVLHMVWTQLPRKTIRIEPVGEGGKTTFVRISKTPLNQLLGRNTVGQWVVVNFPELSLTEWHVS